MRVGREEGRARDAAKKGGQKGREKAGNWARTCSSVPSASVAVPAQAAQPHTPLSRPVLLQLRTRSRTHAHRQANLWREAGHAVWERGASR